MGLFKCRGCEAKDKEIVHLMAQLDRLQGMIEASQKRLAELAEPGLTARIADAERPRVPRRPVKIELQPGFPGDGPERKRPLPYEIAEG